MTKIDRTPHLTHPRILAVDPGKRYAGVAMFEDGLLVACGRPDPGTRVQAPDHALALMTGEAVVAWADETTEGSWAPVVEWMQHRGYRSKTSHTLSELCAVAGFVLGAAEGSGILAPVSEWKSTYPKTVHQPWILSALNAAELAILERATDRSVDQLRAVSQDAASDVVDAVGIGLWAVGRDARIHKPKAERKSRKAPAHDPGEGSGLPDPGALY